MHPSPPLRKQQHASRVISDRIEFYSTRRPRQALDMTTPAEAYQLAARPAQKPLGHYTWIYDACLEVVDRQGRAGGSWKRICRIRLAPADSQQTLYSCCILWR